MKKGGKDKESKPKVDYLDLINKNLQDFKLVLDYSGYQFTRLDLNVFSSLPQNKSLDTLSPLFK